MRQDYQLKNFVKYVTPTQFIKKRNDVRVLKLGRRIDQTDVQEDEPIF